MRHLQLAALRISPVACLPNRKTSALTERRSAHDSLAGPSRHTDRTIIFQYSTCSIPAEPAPHLVNCGVSL